MNIYMPKINNLTLFKKNTIIRKKSILIIINNIIFLVFNFFNFS